MPNKPYRLVALTAGLVLAAAGAAMASGNPDVCKRAAHLEHMCVLGTAICQIKANPAECSQAAYDCYTAETLLDQCDSQPEDPSGKK